MLSSLKTIGYKSEGLYFAHRSCALHSTISSAGYCRETSPAYNWHGIKRGDSQFVLFQYTIAGQGKLRYESAEYDMVPATAMLLHFPHDNQYWLPQDEAYWEFIFICLSGSEILRLCRRIEEKSGPYLKLDSNSPVTSDAYEVVRAVLSGEIKSAFDSSRLAYSFVMRLADTLLAPSAGFPPAIERVMEYCRRHVCEAVTIETMARIADLSRFHFTRIFTTALGVSPARYFQDIRTQHAVGLLQTSNLSIKEIAGQCGFCDATYFCKVFRKSTGMSPRDLRTSGAYVSSG